jgi:prophage antirepressor-like protein
MSSLTSALAVFDTGTELNYIEKEREILFPAEEIGKHLGYSNPGESISNLFNRNQNELKLYSRIINLMSGNNYSQIRVFTEEGVYILSMLARTNEAKKFRARVALLLRRVRQETMRRQIEDARRDAAGLALALTPLAAQRMKAVLRYRERGFSQREIAAVTGIPRRTIRGLEKTAVALGLAAKGA